jgi:hypothetical protein
VPGALLIYELELVRVEPPARIEPKRPPPARAKPGDDAGTPSPAPPK